MTSEDARHSIGLPILYYRKDPKVIGTPTDTLPGRLLRIGSPTANQRVYIVFDDLDGQEKRSWVRLTSIELQEDPDAPLPTLKSCPLCGNSVTMDSIATSEGTPVAKGYILYFIRCGVCTIELDNRDKRRLTHVWNQRTPSQ